MTHDVWLPMFCPFGLLAVLGATSGIINPLLWVSEPLTRLFGSGAAAAGDADGPPRHAG